MTKKKQSSVMECVCSLYTDQVHFLSLFRYVDVDVCVSFIYFDDKHARIRDFGF